MCRALEALPTDGAVQLVRVTVEFVRPVPIGALLVAAEIVRPGKKVRSLRATLHADGALVAHASALSIRKADVALPEGAQAGIERPSLLSVAESPSWVLPFFPDPVGYHTAIDARVAAGEHGSGHMAAWMRPRYPLLPGEEFSPTQKALLFADAGHGLSSALDWAAYTFINPDLTLYLHRPPRGEWLCFDARTVAEPTGIGFAHCAIIDDEGPCGRSSQSLVLDRRKISRRA